MQSTIATEVALGAPRALAARPSPDRLVYDHVDTEGRLEGRLRIAREPDSPALQLGLELLGRPHTVLLGFSPGNGYFTTKRVEIAVCGFAQLCGDVAVVVPDTIAAHTYRARGYTDADARASAKAAGRDVKRRCRRGLARNQAVAPSAHTRVLDWECDVWADPRVTRAHATIERLFEHDASFRAQTLDLVQIVLDSKVAGEIGADALREGASYVLKELAFISVCREILGTEVLIPYHRRWTLGMSLCEGAFGQAIPGVGWLIYDIEVFHDA